GRRQARPTGFGALLRRPLVALVTGLAVVALVVSAATAGLGRFIAMGPMTALTPTILDPSPGPSGGETGATGPATTGAAASEPPVTEPAGSGPDLGPGPTP